MKDSAHKFCSPKTVASELELLKRSSKDHAFDFINLRIAPQFPKNDGKQTPMKGHPVFIAQHATATCCRGCLQKWHRIQKGRALSDNEAEFIVSLIMGWIEKQIGGGENEFIKQQ